MRKPAAWTIIVASIFGIVTIICRPSGPLFLLLPPLVFLILVGLEMLREPPPAPEPRDVRVRVPNAAVYRVGDPFFFADSRTIWEIVAIDRIEDEIYIRRAEA